MKYAASDRPRYHHQMASVIGFPNTFNPKWSKARPEVVYEFQSQFQSDAKMDCKEKYVRCKRKSKMYKKKLTARKDHTEWNRKLKMIGNLLNRTENVVKHMACNNSNCNNETSDEGSSTCNSSFASNCNFITHSNSPQSDSTKELDSKSLHKQKDRCIQDVLKNSDQLLLQSIENVHVQQALHSSHQLPPSGDSASMMEQVLKQWKSQVTGLLRHQLPTMPAENTRIIHKYVKLVAQSILNDIHDKYGFTTASNSYNAKNKKRHYIRHLKASNEKISSRSKTTKFDQSRSSFPKSSSSIPCIVNIGKVLRKKGKHQGKIVVKDNGMDVDTDSENQSNYDDGTWMSGSRLLHELQGREQYYGGNTLDSIYCYNAIKLAAPCDVQMGPVVANRCSNDACNELPDTCIYTNKLENHCSDDIYCNSPQIESSSGKQCNKTFDNTDIVKCKTTSTEMSHSPIRNSGDEIIDIEGNEDHEMAISRLENESENDSMDDNITNKTKGSDKLIQQSDDEEILLSAKVKQHSKIKHKNDKIMLAQRLEESIREIQELKRIELERLELEKKKHDEKLTRKQKKEKPSYALVLATTNEPSSATLPAVTTTTTPVRSVKYHRITKHDRRDIHKLTDPILSNSPSESSSKEKSRVHVERNKQASKHTNQKLHQRSATSKKSSNYKYQMSEKPIDSSDSSTNETKKSNQTAESCFVIGRATDNKVQLESTFPNTGQMGNNPLFNPISQDTIISLLPYRLIDPKLMHKLNDESQGMSSSGEISGNVGDPTQQNNMFVRRSYALPFSSQFLEELLEKIETLKSIAYRSNCMIQIKKSNLLRKINPSVNKHMKYMIMSLTATQMSDITKCLRMLERFNSNFFRRQQCNDHANVLLKVNSTVPENTHLYMSQQRTMQRGSHFGSLKLQVGDQRLNTTNERPSETTASQNNCIMHK